MTHRQTMQTQNGGPEMKKQAFAVRLPEEVLQAIGKIAKEEERSRGAVIRRIIRQYFQVGGVETRLDGKDGEQE